MKILFILNPAAGGAGAPDFREQLARQASRIGLHGDLVTTAAPGHATEIARDAARAGYDVIAAVGGDGTARETAAGLLGTTAALAVLPAGSGNDLARELGLPAHWHAALAALPRATRQLIDVGRANGQPFLQSAGVGADAYIAQLRQRERLFSGALTYAKCAVQGLLQFRPEDVSIEIDGRTVLQRVLAVTVANGERYGGGLKIAPGARSDDGVLDIAVVGNMGRWEALRVFPTVYFGLHTRHHKFRLDRGSRIRVDAVAVGKTLPLHVDGTPHGGTPVEFTVEPRSLAVLALR